MTTSQYDIWINQTAADMRAYSHRRIIFWKKVHNALLANLFKVWIPTLAWDMKDDQGL